MATILKCTTASSASKVVKPLPTHAKGTRLPYEIPDRYQNSFYLANAAFFDSTNWFLHRAYELIFPTLKNKLKLEYNHQLGNNEIAEKVENIVEILDQCNSIIDVRFPLKRDNGKYQLIRGFRAHYGLAPGYSSSLGGLRIDSNITRDHMKALSVLATYRNACMGISVAGAFGGIKICPKDYTTHELEQIVQNYVYALIQKGYCDERDILQPDVNSGEQEMNWIYESYAKFTGKTPNVVSTGKKPELGGFSNYYDTISLGTYLAMNFFLNNEEFMEKIDLSLGLKDKTFIIEGLGKLGKPLANTLVSNGAICVGVKDHDAYLYDPKGINLSNLLAYKAATGSIQDYENAKPHTNDKIFTEQCDILILSALQKSLVCYTADKVKAKVIVEAADGPVTPAAHKILIARSKLVIPDIFACSGGTIASYLEYIKNYQHVHGDCVTILSMSNNIYGNVLSKELLTVDENDGSKIKPMCVDESNILMVAVRRIIGEVGTQIVGVNNFNNLKMDIRSAAYIVAITNIFESIYSKKVFS